MFIKLLKIVVSHFEECLCSLMLGVIAISMNVEIFNRYILFSPSAYTDEIDRMLMLFIVFLGVPWAVKTEKHIIIDLWKTDIKPVTKLILELSSLLIFLIFSIIFSHAALEATEFHYMLASKTEALGFDYWIQLSMLPFAFTLTCFRIIQKATESILACKNGMLNINKDLVQGRI